MPIPLFAFAAWGLFATGGLGLAAYYTATQKTRNKWDKQIADWLGMSPEQVAKAPKEKRSMWQAELDRVATKLFNKPFSGLADNQAEEVITRLARKEELPSIT